MNEEFKAWLQSGSPEKSFECKGDNMRLSVIRIPKNDVFDYLFVSPVYGISHSVDRSCEYKFSSVIHKPTGTVYGCPYDLSKIPGNDTGFGPGPVALSAMYESDVRAEVERIIADDRNNSGIQSLADYPETENCVTRYKEYSVERIAREKFLRGDSDFRYHCDFTAGKWTENSLLDYLADRKGYVEDTAARYISAMKGWILATFMINDMIREAYERIENNANDECHVIRNIMNALKDFNGKSVNVTIKKETKIGSTFEMTFKFMEAWQLKEDPKTTGYCSWYITAQDRVKFMSVFGKNASFYPREIRKITYGKNVLYES